MKIMILAFALVMSHHLFAQCDQALFDKLSNAPQGMNLLNRYSIESKRINDVPFGIQYRMFFLEKVKFHFSWNTRQLVKTILSSHLAMTRETL